MNNKPELVALLIIVLLQRIRVNSLILNDCVDIQRFEYMHL